MSLYPILVSPYNLSKVICSSLRKIYFKLFLILIVLPLSNSVYSKDETIKLDNWTISKDGDVTRYITNGTVVHGHQFGFLKIKRDCNIDILWVSLSGTDKKIKTFDKAKAMLGFEAGKEKFQLGFDDITTFNFSKNIIVVLFTNFIVNERFINLINSAKEMKVNINAPQDLAKLFDIKLETFELKNFKPAREKAKELCLAK